MCTTAFSECHPLMGNCIIEISLTSDEFLSFDLRNFMTRKYKIVRERDCSRYSHRTGKHSVKYFFFADGNDIIVTTGDSQDKIF